MTHRTKRLDVRPRHLSGVTPPPRNWHVRWKGIIIARPLSLAISGDFVMRVMCGPRAAR